MNGLGQVPLAVHQLLNGGEEPPPPLRQRDATAAPQEQGKPRLPFQGCNGVAHPGLGVVQRLRSPRDVAELRHLQKHLVTIERRFHGLTHYMMYCRAV